MQRAWSAPVIRSTWTALECLLGLICWRGGSDADLCLSVGGWIEVKLVRVQTKLSKLSKKWQDRGVGEWRGEGTWRGYIHLVSIFPFGGFFKEPGACHCGQWIEPPFVLHSTCLFWQWRHHKAFFSSSPVSRLLSITQSLINLERKKDYKVIASWRNRRPWWERASARSQSIQTRLNFFWNCWSRKLANKAFNGSLNVQNICGLEETFPHWAACQPETAKQIKRFLWKWTQRTSVVTVVNSYGALLHTAIIRRVNSW